jgi:cardiolipin synthase A/B
MNTQITFVSNWLPVVMHICLALAATTHILFYKRDTRASVGWIGVVWFSPFVGVFLYYILGINRIRRRAALLRDPSPTLTQKEPEVIPTPSDMILNKRQRFVTFADRLIASPLSKHNSCEILCSGESTYPKMLEAIDGAQRTIGLCTYIMDRGQTADEFIKHLVAAKNRGVEIRILIDFVGAHYSLPTIARALRKADIEVRLYLPTFWPWQLGVTNLRNHRKLLICDHKKAFTGGLNIRDSHDRRLVAPHKHVNDVHFMLKGPVVRELLQSFSEDWFFAAGEDLIKRGWQEDQTCDLEQDQSLCRVVRDGPDKSLDKIKWMFLGAIANAQHRIRIVTPYLLPDVEIITALRLAALSGIKVEIIIPEKTNIALVQWACMATIGELLKDGCRIFRQPSPFDHSKIMIIDSDWSFIGSSNWDNRSLRLNFELNIEIYDLNLNKRMDELFMTKKSTSQEFSHAQWSQRALRHKLRDSAANLLSPYL